MRNSLWIILCAISVMQNAAAAASDSIVGAGSSFAAPAYTSWGDNYAKEKKVSLVYHATDSGDGIRQIMAHKVDFGASDYPLSTDELKKNGLLQFPTLVSGIVPVINLPKVRPSQLKLTGTVLAAIFSGRITAWNDREIQALNPGLSLPDLPITLVVRAEDVGTTAAFTAYLSKVDGNWASHMSSGLKVNWPKAVQLAKDNEGIVNAIRATQGSIGYVSANQVFRSKLVYPLLQNRNKQFVAPTDETLLAAAKSSLTHRGDEELGFIDSPAPNAWPITYATYVLIERTPKNLQQASRVLQFFYWSFLRGDAMVNETGYVPLPPAVQARSIAVLKLVRDSRDNPLNFISGTLKANRGYAMPYPIRDWIAAAGIRDALTAPRTE